MQIYGVGGVVVEWVYIFMGLKESGVVSKTTFTIFYACTQYISVIVSCQMDR